MFKVIVLSSSVLVMAQTVAFPTDSLNVYADWLNTNIGMSEEERVRVRRKSYNHTYRITKTLTVRILLPHLKQLSTHGRYFIKKISDLN